MLCLDRVYTRRPDGSLRFARVKAPTREELEVLVQRIAEPVGRALERMGLLQRDAESARLELPPTADEVAMTQLLGSSVTYRIAVGPQAGRKALMLHTITPLAGEDRASERVAQAHGFSCGTSVCRTPAGQPAAVQIGRAADLSLRAGVSREAHQRELRERLCRYIARPAVTQKRLTVKAQCTR